MVLNFNRSIALAITIIAVALVALSGNAFANGSGAKDTTPKGVAQTVQSIEYRGVLSDENGAVLPDGSYTITFAFYDGAESGTELWKETQTVHLENGEFAVALGNTHPLSLSFDESRWLAVNVANSDVETPRTEFLIPSEEVDAR